jgi:small subunit ribosomal protein S16
MATKIRLRRMGTINKPFYRLVVADSRFATTGRFLEVLGWYDPKQADKNFSVNLDRINYWLGTGAQISSTARSLVKKARAGEGVPLGAAPEKQAPETAADLSAAAEAPAEADEVKAEAAEEAKLEEVPAADPSAEADEAKVEEAEEGSPPAEETPEKQEG